MDGFQSEAMNFINEGKSGENSSVQEILPWQKKVMNSDPGGGLFSMRFQDFKKCAFQAMDLKTDIKVSDVHPRIHLFQKATSGAKERYPDSTQNMPFTIRRKLREEAIANRESKKLGIVFTNRGLPVDKVSLHSAASKDAFDLKGLSESLPSTPTSEKNPSIRNIDLRRSCRESRRSRMRGHVERFELLKCHSVYAYCPVVRRSPPFEITPAVRNSMIERNMEDAHSQVKAQCYSRWRRTCIPASELEKESASDEHKETSEKTENSPVDKAFENFSCLVSKFAMPPVDQQKEKREEKQNSDFVNNQLKSGLTSLPKLHQDVGQCSSWDLGTNWDTDKLDVLPVPFNSPSKDGGKCSSWNPGRNWDTDIVPEPLNSSYKKVEIDPLSLFAYSIQSLRAQSKLRMLNFHRGILSEDMDESESEKQPSKQAYRAFIQKFQDSRKEADVFCLSESLFKKCKIKDAKKSVKSFRSFQSRFPLGSVKSDIVVPD